MLMQGGFGHQTPGPFLIVRSEHRSASAAWAVSSGLKPSRGRSVGHVSMIDRAIPLLDPLARALMEEIAEGVVIFDMSGRVAFVNACARGVMRKAGIEQGDRASMLARLSRLGSRIAPIWVGSAKVCEVVFLPADLREEGGKHTLADRERQAILETLDATGWKLTESARRLGISRTTLWRRLRAYDIDRDKRARWSTSS